MNSVSGKLFGAVLALGALSLGAAGAATIPETLGAFGFFGTWATNCDAPASPSNILRSAFISPNGDATISESLGPDSEPNVYVILRAARRPPSIVVLRARLNGEAEQELTMRMNADRLRTMSNRDITSHQFVVRRGRVVSTGRDTPWLAHCNQRR